MYSNYIKISNEVDIENDVNVGNVYCSKKGKKIGKKYKIIILLIILISIGIVFDIYQYFQNKKDVKNKPDVEDFSINNKMLLDYINKNETYDCTEDPNLVFTKGDSRIDNNGIDLNKYILKGMYNQGIDNNLSKKIEEWSLYTPPCFSLKPIEHSSIIKEPNCETLSLQFINSTNSDINQYPFSLQLHEISNQIERYQQWKKENKSTPNYAKQDLSELLNESYHPYDYGYTDEDSKDKTSDPKKRRLFSFISFDFEFDLLDIYISENYEITDYFVIFESNSTTLGQPKPLYFTRMLLETDRYESFKDKLIPIPYIMPKGEEVLKKDINKIMVEEGLRAVNARHGDLFTYGGVDEMAKTHILSRLKKCGGWEHLCSGIGGDDGDTTVKEKSLGFWSWNFQYSFENVENNSTGKIVYPNLAIFNAKRSLVKKSLNDDDSQDGKASDSDSKIDLYKNYYSNYNEENNNWVNSERAILWNAGWYMKNFLPSIDHLYYKIKNEKPSLSCKDSVKVKYSIEVEVDNKTNALINDNVFNDFIPKLTENITSFNSFEYNYWKENVGPSNLYNNDIDSLKKEIPYQVKNNIICYNYMFERNFGINKRLWWEIIPKKEWKNYKFDTKDENKNNKYLVPWLSPFELNDLNIMSSEETIRDIVDNRKSISRYGDGEYSLINNKYFNCGYQLRDRKLVQRLKEILYDDDENFIIGIPDTFKDNYIQLRNDDDFWREYNIRYRTKLAKYHNLNKKYGSAMISRFYDEFYDKSNVAEYVKILKLIWDKKDLLIIEGDKTRFGVGNDLLDNANSIQRILCPAKNAFDVYDEIYEEVLKQDRNKTIITALGPTATVLTYDLYKAGFQAIDIGHADIEYEWFLRKANSRVRINNKFVNEALFGNFFLFGCNDKNYKKQIIARIKTKTNNWFYSLLGI